MPVSARHRTETDAAAVRTREGTGYYRIPSLQGLWYLGLDLDLLIAFLKTL